MARSNGSSNAHLSNAKGQRLRNRQPEGGVGRPLRLAHHLYRVCFGAMNRESGVQQRARIGMTREPKQIVDRTDFNDLAKVHDSDAIGDEAHDAEVMAEKQHRELQLGF